MGYPLINRITAKKDGVYFSCKMDNDSEPYRSVKINGATKAYEEGGRKGLDEYVLKYIGVGQEGFYGQLRGNHPSVERLKAVENIDDLDTAMNQLQLNDLKPVIKDLGWEIDDGIYDIDFFNSSPAGEDFTFCVRMKNFVEEINRYADKFDIIEHVEEWLEAEYFGVRGVPHEDVLLQNAKDIKEMLKTFADKINELDAEYRKKPVLVKSLDDKLKEAQSKRNESPEKEANTKDKGLDR